VQPAQQRRDIVPVAQSAPLLSFFLVFSLFSVSRKRKYEEIYFFFLFLVLKKYISFYFLSHLLVALSLSSPSHEMGRSLRSARLVRRLHPLLRLNAFPFVIFYAVFVLLYLQAPPSAQDDPQQQQQREAAASGIPPPDTMGGASPEAVAVEDNPDHDDEEWMIEVEEWARWMSGENWLIAGVAVVFVHVLSLLLPHWSTTCDCFLTCYTVSFLYTTPPPPPVTATPPPSFSKRRGWSEMVSFHMNELSLPPLLLRPKVKDVDRATLVKVVPRSSVKGSVQLCKLQFKVPLTPRRCYWGLTI